MNFYPVQSNFQTHLFRLIDGSRTATTTLDHNGSESNGNEVVLHTPQKTGMGSLPSDAV